ncbi:ABC transporter ATP-binding protein [Paraferrimonas sedimenticola]|uniref:Probable ATP-binding protein YheS n=1 Tax=Paraferrimonas sedimenticola TaxID=375674 RepID=A0AA37RUU8_9GAMM|nr:ABC transporter ATP-binding protein [Paraferrimonas sedimenticola]GLP95779.1 ABC transporter ATP-binding protein [Paraferrimonas sedimenticola]
MITLNQAQLIRGTRVLLEDANFTIYPGHKVGLVGANGAGKSSLFALLKGEIALDKGECSVPAGWRLASVAQETPELEKSALEYVIDGDVEYRQLEAELAEAQEAHEGEKIALLHGKLDAIGGYSIRARAAELLAGLGFSQDKQSHRVSQFSGGWRMRLNLAQALLCRSELLLLDEPTNHLDLDTLYWLESWLKQYQGTLVLISHDRDFLDNIVTEVIHIERQSCETYAGNYSRFERTRAERMAQQTAQYEKQQKQKAHMQAYVDRFRYKASKARQAQSRLKALEKMADLAPAQANNPFKMQFLKPDALPNPLVTMEKLQVGYDQTPILNEVKLNLVAGTRIGLLGRNGAGKSTLIKLLSGELTPMAGDYQTSQGLSIGYFAQHQLEALSLDDSPIAHLARLAPNHTEQQLRDYLGSFGFSGDKAFSPVRPFSGGEKARLVLSLLVWQKPNLLLMDEPTNHLDLDMRHALTMALQAFEGAMILVSHDRHLLSACCSEYYLVDAGQVQPFNGDLDDYHQWLLDQQRALNEPKTDKPKTDRKAQKRAEAELRQKLSPLTKQLAKLEKQQASLQQELADIDEQLANSDLYEAANKDKLTDLLKSQGELKGRLEDSEMEWFDVQQQVEDIQASAG